jgi:GR25 family glycosyltransferase involved in LPS biosynthesis
MAHIGHYINLDRASDRRAAMETQLAGLDPPARYRRFPAMEGNPLGYSSAMLSDNEIGCVFSHWLLLQMHLDGANHIVEDDAVLAKRSVQFIEQVIASGLLDEHDIPFTSTFMSATLNVFTNFRQEIRNAWKTNIRRAEDGTAVHIQFGSVPYLSGMESYLVDRQSVRLVCDIIGQELDRGATKPLDLIIRNETAAGKLRIGCLFPFISSVLPGAFVSTREPNDARQLSVFAMELLRHSFFVECALKAALELSDRLWPSTTAGQQERLHARSAEFVGSEAFQPF